MAKGQAWRVIFSMAHALTLSSTIAALEARRPVVAAAIGARIGAPTWRPRVLEESTSSDMVILCRTLAGDQAAQGEVKHGCVTGEAPVQPPPFLRLLTFPSCGGGVSCVPASHRALPPRCRAYQL